MNRSVRVSSNVDFTPSRAATMACTMMFSCSSSALNSSSFLANAKVSLPVVRLIFMGGSTPRLRSVSASCGLDIRLSLEISALPSRSAFFRFTSARCVSSASLSKVRTGSVNIRMVRSMRLSSSLGNPSSSFIASLFVISVSLMQ